MNRFQDRDTRDRFGMIIPSLHLVPSPSCKRLGESKLHAGPSHFPCIYFIAPPLQAKHLSLFALMVRPHPHG